MSLVDINFIILTYCGVWRPQKLSSGWKYWLYNIYTAFVIFSIFTLPLSLFKNVISFDYKKNFAESVFMNLTFISICGKILTTLGYRKRIIQLLKTLERDICQVKNMEEEIIQQKFYKLTRSRRIATNWLQILITVISTITFCTINIPNRTLPFNMWVPFDITTNYTYGLVFTEVYIGLLIATIVIFAYHTLVPGIMFEICQQLNILKCRIRNTAAIFKSAKYNNINSLKINKEKIERQLIANWIQHHHFIYQFIHDANNIFAPVIALEYITGSITLCMSSYQMSQIKGFNEKLISVLVYTFTVVSKLFMLCYAGSELTSESESFIHAINEIDWHKLSQSNRKSLLIMMTQSSSRPITFICVKIFNVSLSCFLKIIKISYSAYTFLKQISE
ncbi:hypothetical protein PV328_005223 [Microctonus aethiopoides]|uniref:Odorant receptor n=1 Tax=Microctonus aethiopoides TaxID=144406 RepID=A0AA39FLJ0_9HYME|nr:hypothetical protein PV328_005223 [Microctonus aethiopoides]